MGADRDALFGKLAIERGFLTQAQLDEALEIQRKVHDEMGLDQDLPTVLLSKKLITEDQKQDVENAVAVQTGEARMIGGYEVVSRLGQGGMGVVYKAKKLDTGQFVALKILPPTLANEGMVARFRRESEMTATLDHDVIVKCVEFGRDEKRKVWFCALELVEGEDLLKILKRRGTLPETDAVEIARQIAQALQHAFFNGMIHRDIKPENIMQKANGTVKLLDLGLARHAGSEATRYTQSGMFVGSAYYASPEQASGDSDIDIRGDIYSLGATMYHMVTGSPPFGGTTAQQILYKHVYEKLRWPGDVNTDLSDDFCQVVARMMAKDPADRYQTPKDLLADLDAIKEGTQVDVDERVLRRSTIEGSKAPREARQRRRLKPRSGAGGRALARRSSERSEGGSRDTGARHRRVRDRDAAASTQAGMPTWAPYALGAGGLVVVGVIVAVISSGGDEKPPDRPAFEPVPVASVPSRVEPDAATSGNDTPAPDSAGQSTPAAQQLAKIRAMVTPDLAKYGEIRRLLVQIPTYFSGTPEAAQSKALLFEIDVAYAKLAEGALKTATDSAQQSASRGDFDGAASAIRSVASRFGDGPWLKTTGEAKIAAAVENIEKQRAASRRSEVSNVREPVQPPRRPEPATAEARALAAAMAEFDGLMARPDHTAAARLAEAEAAKPGNAASADVLRAAARIATILRDRPAAIVKGAQALVGTEIGLRMKTGTLTGELKAATEQKLVMATSYMINRQKKQRLAPVAWSSLAPEQLDEFAEKGGLDADPSDLAVARAYAALAEGDANAAGGALDEAGNHTLVAHLTRRVAAAKAQAAYDAAMADARRLVGMRRWKDAVEPLERALDAKPDDADATALMADVRKHIEPEATIALELAPLDRARGRPAVTMEFVYIRPGTFTMGGDTDPKYGWQGVEKPKHEVAITRGFYMGKYEVTRGQFAAFVKATGYKTEAERGGRAWARHPDGSWKDTPGVNWLNPMFFTQDDTHPVMAVSWNDVKAFCDWAAKKTRREVRIPTEAEWEFSCRAGSTADWTCGDESALKDYAWYNTNSGMQTHPVGQKKPNAWGLYDMHGNVWEWVADWYGAAYYESSPREDPPGPVGGNDRLLRGGSWSDDTYPCRSAYRNHVHPTARTPDKGFRAAVSSPPRGP